MKQVERFRALHNTGTFIMPNPWDRGSARILEGMGFPALATTSAGLGRAIGKDDREVTRDELVAHVAELTAILDVPLNVDSERLFPEEPGGIAETVRLLADAGAAGCSIEDYNPLTESITPISDGQDAVAVAAEAAAKYDIVLTARAENHLFGEASVNDTIARLQAYAAAGAEVLFAPGLVAASDISRVVSELERPINVLTMPDGPSVPELTSLGVRRVSVGSWLFNAAYRALRLGARELLDHGTSTYTSN